MIGKNKGDEENMDISRNLLDKVCTLVVLDKYGERKISARIIYINENYVLIENSSGFRSTIRKNKLVRVELCAAYYRNIASEHGQMNLAQLNNETL